MTEKETYIMIMFKSKLDAAERSVEQTGINAHIIMLSLLYKLDEVYVFVCVLCVCRWVDVCGYILYSK